MTTAPATALPAATWTGSNGDTITGTAAAHHLTTTLNILETRGWTRTLTDTEPTSLDGLTKTSPIRDMLHGLIEALRDALAPGRGPITLTYALTVAMQQDAGDPDTHRAAERCLDAALQARTGHATADYWSWSQRIGRTWAEVRELLAEAADLARTHGPAA